MCIWHTWWVITSNMPRQRPNCPSTPASSRTSRRAVTAGSSSGSTPPPGTIQLSGLRLDVTNNTCNGIVQSTTTQRTCIQLTQRSQLDKARGSQLNLIMKKIQSHRPIDGGTQTKIIENYRNYPSASLPHPRDHFSRRYRQLYVCSLPNRRYGLNLLSPSPCSILDIIRSSRIFINICQTAK